MTKTITLILFTLLSTQLCLASGNFSQWLRDYQPISSLKERQIFVYLPSGYQESTQTYPVVYMHDGQNLFDPTRAYMGQTWDVEQSINRLIQQKLIPPLIIVAIDNTSERIDEFTPTVDSRYGGGRAEEYLKMVIEHLIPKVETHYRTNNTRALIGSSLGGLVSLYAISKHPSIFSKVAALSPSLWWDDKSILKTMSESRVFPNKLWVDSGSLEDGLPEDLKELSTILRERVPRNSLKVVIQTGASHSEKYWAMRFPYVIHYLFRN